MATSRAELLVYTLIWIAIGCVVYLFIARDSVKLTNEPRIPPTVEGNETLHSPGTRDMYKLRKEPTKKGMRQVKKNDY